MTKIDFTGGLRNQFISEKEDLAASYRLLINARVRDNAVRPIELPVEDNTLPAGLRQGLYAFDQYVLAFVAGAAYYKALGATTWTRIVGFSMSATEARIYLALVPASTLNFMRNGTTNELLFSSPVAQAQSALVCMDGVTQPNVIFPDGSARATNGWNDWTPTNREYVPIGKFPLFVNGKLYCAIKDRAGRWTLIAGSVSGRPLDFVLLVNEQGGKAGASELDYGAPALAYSVSYNELTALARVNTAERAFLATVVAGAFLVLPDYANKIAGEPTYGNQELFAVGAFGPEAITDLNGDTAVVYKGGIRTFNGVSQLKWEGRNAPLMRNIQTLVGDTLQTYGATVQFNNYVGFALQTIRGAGIIWWDDTLGNFVALDLYQGAGRIKQFAVINTATEQELYFVTFDDRLFRAFAGDFAEAAIMLHDVTAGDAGGTLNLQSVTPAFELSASGGYVTVNVVADGRLVEGATRALAATEAAETPSGRPAVTVNSAADAPRIVINNYNAARNGVEIRWSGGAALTRVDVDTAKYEGSATQPFTTDTAEKPEQLFIFIGDDGLLNANRTAVYNAIAQERDVTAVLGLGDHAYSTGTQAEVDTNMAPYWERYRTLGRFFAVAGNHDNDSGYPHNGTAFFQYVRQSPARYSKVSFDDVDFFLFDTGYTTALGQVNPDNQDGASISVSTQANWLVAELLASTKRNKIVLWHQPAYTSSATYGPGKVELQPLVRRAIDAGATAIINGHAHLYERIVNEIPQFIVGTGGAALHSIGTRAAGSMKALASYGYLRARVSPLRVVYEFVSVDGIVLDKFVA